VSFQAQEYEPTLPDLDVHDAVQAAIVGAKEAINGAQTPVDVDMEQCLAEESFAMKVQG